jgi:ubiquinone/menaquinone biosynthesis C-methylase UbiE
MSAGVRDPLGLNERLFAWYYPKVVGMAERAGQAETRRELLSAARGRTLEIGAGSGFNLPHYTEAVTELVLSDPSPHMREHLRERLESDPPPVGSWKLADASAERLPFEDESFDTVTGGFVMCSVPDPELALAEIARVLRPGGRYLFIEHVHAGEGTLLGRFQDLWEVPHRYIAAGCHPNRRTWETIESSPLEVERLEHGEQPKAPPMVKPTILGSAVRPPL